MKPAKVLIALVAVAVVLFLLIALEAPAAGASMLELALRWLLPVVVVLVAAVLLLRRTGKARFHGAPVSEVWELKITAKNRLSEIARLVTCFEEFADRHELPVAVNRKTKTIIDEVLNNVICYAYEDDSEQDIVVRLTKTEDEMTVAFEDSGAPFDPLAHKDPDTESGIIDRKSGGLGIFLVRKLSDDINYSRRDDRNVLTVSMRLEQEGTA